MKNILFPTDFSEGANNALEFARKMAGLTGAKLIYFNVYHVPVVTPLPADMHDSMKDEAQRRAEDKLMTLGTSHGNDNYETIATMGLGVDEIVDMTKTRDIDMIIMGTKGASGLKEVVLGSIAGDVIAKVKCPVLAIPEDATLDGLPIQKILYATDFDISEMPAYKQLVSFARMFNSEILFLHVSKVAFPDQSGESNKAVEFLTDLEKASEYKNYKYLHYYSEDVDEGIHQYVENHDIDMIAMVTHKRNFFEKIFSRSKTKKMAFHTHTPLLAFHN